VQFAFSSDATAENTGGRHPRKEAEGTRGILEVFGHFRAKTNKADDVEDDEQNPCAARNEGEHRGDRGEAQIECTDRNNARGHHEREVARREGSDAVVNSIREGRVLDLVALQWRLHLPSLKALWFTSQKKPVASAMLRQPRRDSNPLPVEFPYTFLYSFHMTLAAHSRPERTVSVSAATGRGVAGLVKDAEHGEDVIIERHGRPVAAVVSIEHFDEIQDIRADLNSAALVLARELSDPGDRSSLDQAIESFGFDRAKLEAELDADLSAGRE